MDPQDEDTIDFDAAEAAGQTAQAWDQFRQG